MKNSNDTIRNRTRELSACSAVPQPTAPLRAPNNISNLFKTASALYRGFAEERFERRFLVSSASSPALPASYGLGGPSRRYECVEQDPFSPTHMERFILRP
jgi:hypothetical protein